MKIILGLLAMAIMSFNLTAETEYEKDMIMTSIGAVEITFIGHASLMIKFNGKIIHIDPYGKLADYSNFPKADMILITHSHPDHFDKNAMEQITKNDTKLFANEKTITGLGYGQSIINGEKFEWDNIKIEAVPAYNIVHKILNITPYHPKGEGNGYILTFGEKRILVAGDTENIPEIKELKDIDYAFLPMNLPYTMTPEMVADAAMAFKPKVLYPYHYGSTDVNKLKELLKNEKDIEVRIRKME